MKPPQNRSKKIPAQSCVLQITSLKHSYPSAVPHSSDLEAHQALQNNNQPPITYGDLYLDDAQVKFHTDCRRVGFTILLQETLRNPQATTETESTYTSIDFYTSFGDILCHKHGLTKFRDHDTLYL
jgi:hypothetical protein